MAVGRRRNGRSEAASRAKVFNTRIKKINAKFYYNMSTIIGITASKLYKTLSILFRTRAHYGLWKTPLVILVFKRSTGEFDIYEIFADIFQLMEPISKFPSPIRY